jgi:methionine-gamma-lyase
MPVMGPRCAVAKGEGSTVVSDKNAARKGFSTRAIHHGHDPYVGHGALNPPLYLSSTYAFPTVEDGAARFAGEQAGFVYSRVGNPTTMPAGTAHRRPRRRRGRRGHRLGAGRDHLAAVDAAAPGDEVIADKTLYGCTFGFLNHGLAKFGVKITHVDLTDPRNLEAAIGPQTKLVFFESPANPNMRLVDIAAISAIARRHGALTVVDNTYCTPYLQRPIELGADYVLHSATKYLGGHGDLIAGAIVGPKEPLLQVRFYGLKDMTGAVLSSQDAFLILRGIKTLSLRMHRHSENAQGIAEYPGAPSQGRGLPLPGADIIPAARTGAAADEAAGRHAGFRTQGRHRGRAPLHERASSATPKAWRSTRPA